MAEIRYLISDASKKVDVEAHVLRYWEEELEIKIPRNEMGHRYYTELHIRLFQKIKELKEKGYQLKAIKNVLSGMMSDNGRNEISKSDSMLEKNAETVLKETTITDDTDDVKVISLRKPEENLAVTDEKMEQFQSIMTHIIGRALEINNEKVSQDISNLVNEKMGKEMEYLLRISDEKEDERFKHLDETIRAYQQDGRGRAEAAAAKIPFFKKSRKK